MTEPPLLALPPMKTAPPLVLILTDDGPLEPRLMLPFIKFASVTAALVRVLAAVLAHRITGWPCVVMLVLLLTLMAPDGLTVRLPAEVPVPPSVMVPASVTEPSQLPRYPAINVSGS